MGVIADELPVYPLRQPTDQVDRSSGPVAALHRPAVVASPAAANQVDHSGAYQADPTLECLPVTPTNREARMWDQVRAQAAARKLASERQAAVAAYVQSNTPKGASGCNQAAVSHEGRAGAARGSRPQSFAGMNSARATVSTTAAAPAENPGTVSLTPRAADGAGLGFDQGALF